VVMLVSMRSLIVADYRFVGGGTPLLPACNLL
jgi:hypothetical protein